MPAGLLLLLAAISLPPKPIRHVTDRTGVLKDINALDAKLAQFERQTSDQVLVYVDRRLPPNTTIEEMGSEAMRKWAVGQKGKDNGAILFVFVADRKMRIEVGYGLEGSLTDAKSKWITSTVIKPEFQRGDYGAGIEKGIDAMLATIRGEPYRGSGATVAESKRVALRNDAGPLGCLLLALLWSCLIPVGNGIGWLIKARTFGVKSIVSILLAIVSVGLFIALWRSVPPTSDYGSVVAFGLVVPLVIGLGYSLRALLGRGLGLWLATMARSAGGASSSSSSSDSTSTSSSGSSSSSSSFEGGGGSGGGGGASDSW